MLLLLLMLLCIPLLLPCFLFSLQFIPLLCCYCSAAAVLLLLFVSAAVIFLLWLYLSAAAAFVYVAAVSAVGALFAFLHLPLYFRTFCFFFYHLPSLLLLSVSAAPVYVPTASETTV